MPAPLSPAQAAREIKKVLPPPGQRKLTHYHEIGRLLRHLPRGHANYGSETIPGVAAELATLGVEKLRSSMLYKCLRVAEAYTAADVRRFERAGIAWRDL